MSETVTGPTPDPWAAQAEEAARQAHAARQRADDDASYAHKAKVASEEHSKAIAVVKGQAEADASWFTTTKQSADEARATINQIRAEADSAKQAITDAVAEVDKGRTAVKSHAEQVDAHRAQAEKAAGEAQAHAKAASSSMSTAESCAADAQTAHGTIQKLLEGITALAVEAESNAKEIDKIASAVTEAHDAAQALVAAMTAAEKKAADVLAIVALHEQDLARLKDECSALHTRIESLLPNATSAGLATAFRDQQARFIRPQRGWLVTFIVAIVALLASSLVGLPSASGTWDQMAKHLINRLPLIVPLIWLAVYAGRHYGLALRLQEEYAYKEAVSAAFEGYKREMTGVAAAAGGSAGPLVTLCESVLRTLGQRPGRIYEGKHEDITPLTPIATVVRDGIQAAGTARLQAPTGGGAAAT